MEDEGNKRLHTPFLYFVSRVHSYTLLQAMIHGNYRYGGATACFPHLLHSEEMIFTLCTCVMFRADIHCML